MSLTFTTEVKLRNSVLRSNAILSPFPVIIHHLGPPQLSRLETHDEGSYQTF